MYGKNLPCRAFLVPHAAEFSYAKTREPALRTQRCMREPDSTAGKYNRNHALSGLPAVSCGKVQKQTRVQLYLPIADIPVNVFLILEIGRAHV